MQKVLQKGQGMIVFLALDSFFVVNLALYMMAVIPLKNFQESTQLILGVSDLSCVSGIVFGGFVELGIWSTFFVEFVEVQFLFYFPTHGIYHPKNFPTLYPWNILHTLYEGIPFHLGIWGCLAYGWGVCWGFLSIIIKSTFYIAISLTKSWFVGFFETCLRADRSRTVTMNYCETS